MPLVKDSFSRLLNHLLLCGGDGILTIEQGLASIGVSRCLEIPNAGFVDQEASNGVLQVFYSIVYANPIFDGDLVTVKTGLGSYSFRIVSPDELIFVDSVKLLDMLVTDSFPSQISAYYRENPIPGSAQALKQRVIALSDGATSLNLRGGGSGWVVLCDGKEITLSDDIVVSLKALNRAFLAARHAEMFMSNSPVFDQDVTSIL